MNIQNALIKKCWVEVSEQYSQSLALCLELELQGGGCVIFTAWGPYTEDFKKNTFAYSVKKVMDICGVERLDQIQGSAIRAKFKEDGGLGDVIIGIGHFLRETWFIPREEKLYQNT